MASITNRLVTICLGCSLFSASVFAQNERGPLVCFKAEDAQVVFDFVKSHGEQTRQDGEDWEFAYTFRTVDLAGENNNCIDPRLRVGGNGFIAGIFFESWCDLPLGPDIFALRKMERAGIKPQELTTFAAVEMALTDTGFCILGSTPHVQVKREGNEYDEYTVPGDSFLILMQTIGSGLASQAKQILETETQK